MVEVTASELFSAVDRASKEFGKGFVPEGDSKIREIISDSIHRIIFSNPHFTEPDDFDRIQNILTATAVDIITKSFIANNPGYFNADRTAVTLSIPTNQIQQLFVLVQAVVEEVFDRRRDLEIMEKLIIDSESPAFDEKLNNFLETL